jgi:hypothetical protein
LRVGAAPTILGGAARRTDVCTRSCAAFGHCADLPRTGLLVCNLNAHYKIDTPTWIAWTNIVRRSADAVRIGRCWWRWPTGVSPQGCGCAAVTAARVVSRAPQVLWLLGDAPQTERHLRREWANAGLAPANLFFSGADQQGWVP